MSATDGALILESANSNENIYNSATGEFTSYLRGNVSFLYDDLRISADEATWQRNDGIVDFVNNVAVEHRGQLMTCGRLRFVRDNNVLTASDNVFYQDSARITFISGTTAEYMTDIKEAVLSGDPLLSRIDSADTEIDTTFIRGILVRYNDSLKIATVTDSVRITRGSLAATGQICRYFADDNKAILRVDPVIHYEGHKVVGDSVDLFLGKESLESAVVIGNTHGFYMDVADSTSDTTVTNIWSDSLHLSMFESGKINAMKAFGNARGDFSETKPSSNTVTATNFSSDSMHVFMFESGKIRQMKAFGNANGDYSETNRSSNVVTNTVFSSDSMHIFMFETGKIRAIMAYGGAQGEYSETNPSSNSVSETFFSSDSMHIFMFETGKVSAVKAYGGARGNFSETSASTPASQPDSAQTSRISATKTALSSDSLHILMFETGKVSALHAFGGAHGRSAEWSSASRERDSSITHIWSDSLRVAMTEAGKIRTMRAFGGDSADVRSLSFIAGDSARANEVTGRRMTLLFTPAGRIERAVVTGNAKSLYHLSESDGGGLNRAEGDRIVVTFAAGKAQRLRVLGNVKGFYSP